MKLFEKIKSLFIKKKPEEPVLLDVEKIIHDALRSPYKDVSNYAQKQQERLAGIERTREKLNVDIKYYEDKKKDALAFLDSKLAEIETNVEKYELVKEAYEEKEKERNKSDAKRALESYNISKLTKTVQSYGFDIGMRQIGIYMLIVIAIPTAIAYISQLHIRYIAIVAALGFLTTPAVIYAYYKQKFNERRFEMVIDYLTNILPIFMQKAKIVYALNEVKDLVRYQIRQVIIDALDYIDENNDDTEAERTALEMIEAEFPNSRIKAVHDIMLTVERENSTEFKSVCQDMYTDIDGWIRRVNDFQRDLRDRRNKLILLCGITLAMNCVFVFLYTGNEYFLGFTDNELYQIGTMIFIMLIIVIGAMALARLNGTWLIDDLNDSDEKEIKRAYRIWEEGRKPAKLGEILLSLFCFAAGAYYFAVPNIAVALVLFFMGAMIITTQGRRYNSAYRRLNEHFAIEFPNWLREITLNIHTSTVVNAIQESMYTCSYPMFRQLELFMEDIDEDPTSIKPFNNLLHDFDLKDAQSSLKVLYSVQTYGQEEINDQVSSLVTRNQAMLDKAESMKNQNNLSGVEALGYLPMVVFSISMIVNMILLFSHMMSMLSQAMNGNF